MATAETRRKEEEARRGGDGAPGKKPQRQRSTRQLDFFQAMSDFKNMFPTLDDEVIEAVLRANDGAVDATIDQLLTMTIDEDMSSVKTVETSSLTMPKYEDRGLACGGVPLQEDSPPSYSEAMRTPGPTDQAQSIWTTPIGHPSPPTRLQLEVESHPEPLGAMARLSPIGLAAGAGHGFSPVTETPSVGFRRANSVDSQSIVRKREFRNWNPPMLGNLPDDFLRLTVPESDSGASSAKFDTDRTASLSTTPVNTMSLTDARPKVHRNRSKSEKVSRSLTLGSKDVKEKELKSRSSEKKNKSSDGVVRSFSVADGARKSSGARHKERQSELSPSRSRNHSVIIETHDFSKNMLEERIKENERQRRNTSAEFDPELAQFLEDERLALALQNSEFLQELRSNDDFMKTLEKERSSSKPKTKDTSQSRDTNQTVSAPVSPPVRPPEDVHEGYGDDGDKTLDAFPFSQPAGREKDEDAELRRQLNGMGKASRKQLASLARKFFKRKKKSSKQILREKLAPSMVNLLEEEDDEEDDDMVLGDGRYVVQSGRGAISPDSAATSIQA